MKPRKDCYSFVFVGVGHFFSKSSFLGELTNNFARELDLFLKEHAFPGLEFEWIYLEPDRDFSQNFQCVFKIGAQNYEIAKIYN